MTLYLSFILFLFLIVSIYRNKGSVSIRFLVGMFTGLIMSIFSLVLYLSKQNYYWQEVNEIFYMSRSLWNFLIIKVNISPILLIRGLNIGVSLTFYSAICFGIAFTSRKDQNNIWKYILLSIPPIIQVIFFDPRVQTHLQLYVGGAFGIGFERYNYLLKYILFGFSIINLGYCITMVGMLVISYINYPKIKFLKRYTLFNILCITPITGLFYYMFKWYPTILVKATMKKNYYNYLIPNIKVSLLNNEVYYLSFLALYIALLIYIYKYSTMESYYKRDSANIEISMDTASLGINTITHAIKNHIQGIKSEAEYLSKIHKDDETNKSIELIKQSCEFCFDSINYANKQLNSLKLNLKLLPIEKSILKAISKFNSSKEEIPIIYIPETKGLMSYIDEEVLTEVLVNLISNSIEALEDKSNPCIDITIKEKGRWAVVEISDNGSGIKEEDRNKIFTPFFSTKTSIKNWGIGLAYCYKVINAHDGKIVVSSKEGIGTTISIALPIV